MENIHSYQNYKEYLLALCESERGMLTRLSEAGGVQKSYLSLCLKGKNNLTLDHAAGICDLLGFSESEENYFFLLVEKERASSSNLRDKLESRIKAESREASRLKNHQANTVTVNAEDVNLAEYYESWLPTALHTLTSIPAYQSVSALGKRTRMVSETVENTLATLVDLGFVKFANGKYQWSSGNLHLPDGSRWLNWHHINWRHRAIDNIQKKDPSAIHYSVVQSMSRDDFEVLKRSILAFIKNFNKVSDPSTPEEAYALNLDFFAV